MARSKCVLSLLECVNKTNIFLVKWWGYESQTFSFWAINLCEHLFSLFSRFVVLPQVCFSLQSAVVWDLFLFLLGRGGVGLARGGHTWGPDGGQQINGWGPEKQNIVKITTTISFSLVVHAFPPIMIRLRLEYTTQLLPQFENVRASQIWAAGVDRFHRKSCSLW